MTILLTAAVACLAAACFEIDEVDEATSPTPQCTPPTANDVDVTLAVTDADAFVGRPVLARFVAPTQVLSCTSSLVPAGGEFELMLSGGGVIGNAFLEVVLSSDGEPAHGGGDLTQSFSLYADGTLTEDYPCSVHVEWDLTFSAESPAEAVTWELGASCPGTN